MLTFFYTLGTTYPWIGSLATLVSGPLSYIVFPALVLGFFSTRTKGSMNNFSLVFLTLFFSWVTARLLKEIFQVARPFHTHAGIVPSSIVGGYSFPSEHAALYGALTVVLFHFDQRLGVVGLVIALLVMVSRVVLGVHYPFDVLAGALVGGTVAYIFIRLFRRLSL